MASASMPLLCRVAFEQDGRLDIASVRSEEKSHRVRAFKWRIQATF